MLTWRQTPSPPVAVLVTWGAAAAGADTGGDAPLELLGVELLADPDVAALAWEGGALSMGGAASIVNPPDDCAPPDEEDELWLLEELGDACTGAALVGEVLLPTGLATALAGVPAPMALPTAPSAPGVSRGPLAP